MNPIRPRPIRSLVLRGAMLLVLIVAGCASFGDHAAEAELIAGVLHLEPGMHVADVGAGDGDWTVELARRVGSDGHVFATEVDEDDLESIRDRVEEDALENVTVILGDQESTGLPQDCCDAILLRLVYHHFVEPAKMRKSLEGALRPGGKLAVVEVRTQRSWDRLEDVPERDGHGIEPGVLIEEMSDRWTVVERHDDWEGDDDHYCVVFREQD